MGHFDPDESQGLNELTEEFRVCLKSSLCFSKTSIVFLQSRIHSSTRHWKSKVETNKPSLFRPLAIGDVKAAFQIALPVFYWPTVKLLFEWAPASRPNSEGKWATVRKAVQALFYEWMTGGGYGRDGKRQRSKCGLLLIPQCSLKYEGLAWIELHL